MLQLANTSSGLAARTTASAGAARDGSRTSRAADAAGGCAARRAGGLPRDCRGRARVGSPLLDNTNYDQTT
jgi:hypothetical protein